MTYFTHLFFGLLVGFVGVIPPGLLNLTAAKISMKQNKRSASVFAVGASLIVVLQVFLGLYFSKLLHNNPEVLIDLQRIAIFLFFGLSIFFLIKARLEGTTEIKKMPKSFPRLFAQGLTLSVLNIFPIPFYVGFSSFLANRSLFVFEFPMAHLFVFGASLGTFLMLWVYIFYVKRFGFDSRTFARKVHYILAVLTFCIALVSLIQGYEDLF